MANGPKRRCMTTRKNTFIMMAAILPGNYSMLSVINVHEIAIKPMDGCINFLAYMRVSASCPGLIYFFYRL